MRLSTTLILCCALGCSDSKSTDTSPADSADSDAELSPDTGSSPDVAQNDDSSVPDANDDVAMPPADMAVADLNSDMPRTPTDYEGFGAVTMGAQSSPNGFETYTVTSLDDDGPGTLRDALSQGERLIEFDVSGTITLQSDLNVRWSYITIDGSTAPAPGITVEQPGDIGTTIEARASTGPASDIIIRDLRMDGLAGGQHTNAGDIWGIDGENAPVSRVIIDHVTATSSTDGVFDIWGDVSDITISWNLIRNTVTALHLSTGDTSQVRRRVSFHHNVFAENNERQIRIRHNNDSIDFVNNVIYGWGWMEAGAAGLHVAYDAGETNPSLNVENNAFVDVAGLNGDADDAIIFERGGDEGSLWFSGNLLPGGEADNQSTAGAALPVDAAAQVTTWSASELGARVVPTVGMLYRSADETQLLNTIATAIP